VTPLSAVIITFNEERNVVRCLDSLRGVADEIVVVDSGSTDGTRALCQARGARVLVRPFDGFTAQKNFAVEQARHDHVLSLDADEWLSPQLRASILAARADWRADGYEFNRLNHYGARPIRSCGWYPDRKVRLWDRRRGRWEGGLVHETVAMAPGARVERLEGDLLHRAYERAGQLVDKLQRYSDLWARDKAGRRRVGTAGIAAKAAAAFLKAWLLKGGFRDGYEGFVVSASLAGGVLYNNAKLLEANRALPTSLVVTTYNRPDALALVLRSVAAQLDPPDEVIVADDGSRDDTRRLVEAEAARFPVPLRHCWQEDQGFRAAAIRNKAFAMARGDYLVMIDGDVVLDPRFVRDHRRAARRGWFVQGSRAFLGEAATAAALREGRVAFGPLAPGLWNRKNAVHSPLLSRLASHRSRDVFRVRSANLACWREDVLRVNGFDEDFVGWGREDSEFVARLQHAGVRKLHLKFAGFGYHLHHPEASRQALPRNDEILERTLSTRAVRCRNGIDQHLAAPG
jgi:glycosyltransferase involved in cell wall biosynthesis